MWLITGIHTLAASRNCTPASNLQATLSVTVATSLACMQASDTQSVHAQIRVLYVLWCRGALAPSIHFLCCWAKSKLLMKTKTTLFPESLMYSGIYSKVTLNFPAWTSQDTSLHFTSLATAVENTREYETLIVIWAKTQRLKINTHTPLTKRK